MIRCQCIIMKIKMKAKVMKNHVFIHENVKHKIYTMKTKAL